MYDCSMCQKETVDVHIVFIDEYYRTYQLLCEECFQHFTIEWEKMSDLPVPEYIFPKK